MSHINERWVAIDGSVYTEEAYLRQVAAGEVKYRPGIAYNVGQMVAEHIVRVHNASLLGYFELDLPPEAMASLLEAARNQVHVPPVQRAPGMSSVMQVQGSSLRPADLSQRAVDLGGVRRYEAAPPNGTLTLVSVGAQPSFSHEPAAAEAGRPVLFGAALVHGEPAPKPCCGCRKV